MLFFTGFADHRMLNGVGEAQIIPKPFVTGTLAEKAHRALAGRMVTSD